MDSVCAKERIDLLLEQRAIFHPAQIKEREKLFLAVSLQCFAELQKHTGTSLRVESGSESAAVAAASCAAQGHTEKQRNENGRRAATHAHRLQDRRRPPRSAGLQ